MLTIRHELHPRRCGHGMDKQRLFEWGFDCKCASRGEFEVDSPGELAASVCMYHVGKVCEKWAVVVSAQFKRDYDQQTTRLRALGEPCRICGVRRECHHEQIIVDLGFKPHQWTDDEDTAEIFERDRK